MISPHPAYGGTGREVSSVADTHDWEERCEAARVLARYTDDASAAALGGLLLDGQVGGGNWAVVVEAPKALLQRSDLYGAELVFAIVAIASAETNNHLLSEISAAENEGVIQLDRLASEIEEGASAWARAGLTKYGQWHNH